MTGAQASGAGALIGLALEIVFVMVVGGGLLILTSDEIERMRERRRQRRADVRFARDCCPAHGLDFDTAPIPYLPTEEQS